MKIFSPQPGSWRRLGVAVGVSLLVHLGLVALVLLIGHLVPPVIVKKGEPLFVELPKPEEEPAPRGNPALPPGPPARPSPPPAPKTPPAKPAPKVEAARPAPKAEPAPPAPKPATPSAPPQVAQAAPPVEPEGTKRAPAAPREQAKPEPPAGEPKVVLSKPAIDLPPSLQGGTGGGRPGGGGGLLGGRGGIEGEPVPLDTRDPRYTDYFEQIRRRIKENWIYPHEAGDRGIGGQLVIEFAIRKDGWLQFVDLKRSSGVPILDQYALNALKLAQPFPPIPDSVSKGSLPVAGIFTYQIVDAGLLNQFLR